MSSPLIQNIENLQNILNTINELPEASSGVELPALTNPGSAQDLLTGRELINGEGNIITGTMPIVEQATPNIEIDSNGLITASAIQSEGYVIEGTKSSTNQLAVQEEQTIIPGISDIVIDSGKYLTGVQTIKGDSNLVADNIKKSVSIFGVTGTKGELDFEVVGGTTAPANPKENMIWIETDVPITNWTISAYEPYQDKVDIYTSDGLTTGYYINSSGALASYSSWNVTKKLPLPENTKSVYIPSKELTTSNVAYAFYDENDNFISATLRVNDTFKYTVPDNAKSMRASIGSTDQKHIFAQVFNAIDGDIWISIDSATTNRSLTLDLETERLDVCLLSAKQYISGVWKKKTTKIYRNGIWIPCVTRIYDAGNSLYSVRPGAMRPSDSYTAPAEDPTITFNSSNFVVSNSGSSSAGSSGVSIIDNVIDLTDASTLYIEGDFKPPSTSYKTYPICCVWSRFGTYAIDNRQVGVSPCSATGASTTTTVKLPVENLRGRYYIGFTLYAQANTTCSATIRQIYYD